ncbi:hypothetical protein F441_07687 [Phytophthora nicotianae CJ01A1]|uniref:Uncharacterized protein n=3 Tax=Phytophthora nicotianae TaxID=4792 RepID=W2ZID2_PHYNI|nr:hypothetical protein F441_07687 [Phytophthora nicotianae CJ01A1]ETP45979.1 hypothetical protein F442_07718 [Phytophthora nicotianae P10297]
MDRDTVDTELATYEEVLERWAFTDCSGFDNALSDSEMRALFSRWRATRSKPDAAIGSVTAQSMDRAWTGFVNRWNTEGPPAFQQKLLQREEQHSRLSVGALVAQICELSWDADRDCCFAHYRLGCPSCRGYSVPRPSSAVWERITSATPLSEAERRLVGLFQRALHEARRDEESRPVDGRPRTPPRNPERPPAAPPAAPSCRPANRSTVPSIGGSSGYPRRVIMVKNDLHDVTNVTLAVKKWGRTITKEPSARDVGAAPRGG